MTRRELLKHLADTITQIRKSHPLRIAIDGVRTSGKTILAGELSTELEQYNHPAIMASVEGFHNPRENRYRKGRNSPEGYYLDSFDNNAIINNLLQPLGPKGNLEFKTAVFDFKTNTKVISSLQKAETNSILLFEGVFLFRPELKDHWDFKIFLDVDFETTVKRACERDYHLGTVQEITEKYAERYNPGQKLYLEQAKPKQQANIVIDNNEFKKPRITKEKKSNHFDPQIP